jgi:RNA polymerase sigma factor (sigma-70 family)
MGDAASLTSARVSLPPFRSKRLLALAGDEKLVEQIRRGNEAAFEVAFERHGAGILGFCRHMLGSKEEAEDAVQHTFAAAFRELRRDGERRLALKPWLYAIARNRCLSVLRSRRERATEQPEPVSAGLAEQVERRAELRAVLRDLRELPEDQRAALLLSEAGDLSHAEIANVLGCPEARVKALVFRARSGLIQRRAARETPCEEIRVQLANLRGGSLRRSELRHHLRVCAGCRDYREQVKQQRRMLAAALPVAPSLGLKSSVLAAVGLGGGSAGGGLAAGLGAAGSASFGSATLAKVAVVGVLAGGGAVAGKTVIDETGRPPDARPPAAAPAGPAGPAAHARGARRAVAGACGAPRRAGRPPGGQAARDRAAGQGPRPPRLQRAGRARSRIRPDGAGSRSARSAARGGGCAARRPQEGDLGRPGKAGARTTRQRPGPDRSPAGGDAREARPAQSEAARHPTREGARRGEAEGATPSAARPSGGPRGAAAGERAEGADRARSRIGLSGLGRRSSSLSAVSPADPFT